MEILYCKFLFLVLTLIRFKLCNASNIFLAYSSTISLVRFQVNIIWKQPPEFFDKKSVLKMSAENTCA